LSKVNPSLGDSAVQVFSAPSPRDWRSLDLSEQRFCLSEIGRVEPLGEPAVDRREKVAGFLAPTLLTTQPGIAHGSAQLPELGLLAPGDAEGFAVQVLGGLGMP
jgi:hypothetical protein